MVWVFDKRQKIMANDKWEKIQMKWHDINLARALTYHDSSEQVYGVWDWVYKRFRWLTDNKVKMTMWNYYMNPSAERRAPSEWSNEMDAFELRTGAKNTHFFLWSSGRKWAFIYANAFNFFFAFVCHFGFGWLAIMIYLSSFNRNIIPYSVHKEMNIISLHFGLTSQALFHYQVMRKSIFFFLPLNGNNVPGNGFIATNDKWNHKKTDA